MFGFGKPTLVLRQFDINESATEGPPIEIEGRATGFMQWLLTAMKISTLTTLRLDTDRVSFVNAGLDGEEHTVIPLAAIDSTQCGYSKSILLLVAAVGVLLFGSVTGEVAPMFVSLIFAAVLGASYYFSDKMFISISAGSTKVTIEYKKGVIEGVNVDLERSLQAIRVINERIMAQRAK